MNRIRIWYDYGCLPQRPRDPEAELLFQDGLKALPACQALGRTMILLDDPLDYLSRAWCTIEAMVGDAVHALDILAGSTERAHSDSHRLQMLLDDRPHFRWRGILDTELFCVQPPEECMQRLGLSVTDPSDLLLLYERFRELPAPDTVHVDAGELVTGTLPLAVVDGGNSVAIATRTGGPARLLEESRVIGTLNWASALHPPLHRPAARPASAPFQKLDAGPTPWWYALKRRRRAHLHVIGSCEGEAVLFSNWALQKRQELETVIRATVTSASWLAIDIAPVGHFICGSLGTAAVDEDMWIIVTLGTRLLHCGVVGAIVRAAAFAGRDICVVALDARSDNVRVLPRRNGNSQSDANEYAHKRIDPAVGPSRTFPGGVYRDAVLSVLLH